MKGKATLILTDADSGRVVKRLEENNIVTNAVSNIFNFPLYYRMNEVSQTNMFTTGLPIWKTVMGGIVLLGSNMEEDVNNIFFPESTKFIAAAGAPYSGTNPNIGTLNESECCVLDNGFRLVWDFATDKANDTIKCVCLTSRQFGNSSAGNSDYTRGCSYIPISSLNSNSTSNLRTEMFRGLGQYVYSKTPTTHIFYGSISSNTLRFAEHHTVDPKNILITDIAGINMTPAGEVHDVQVPFTATNDSCFFFDPDKTLMYFFKGCVYNSKEDKTEFEYYAVNLNTYEVEYHGKTYFSGRYSCSNIAAIYKNCLYVVSNGVLHKYSLDGTLLKTYDSGIYTSFFFVLNGCLYTFTQNNVLYMVTPEKGYKLGGTNLAGIAHNPYIKPPCIAVSTRTLHTNSTDFPTAIVQAFVLSSYMATINNLAEPLEKTSAQTLKIIYEITN